jgi:RNA polymerase sigma factor (sigma-70 family)
MQIRNPKRWLCKTVKNCYLNRRRGMLQYSTESLEQIKLSSAEEDLPFGDIPDCSENQPERVVEYNEEVKRVREQIAEIPTTKDARETLALYLLGELSRSEIARESGKSIGTVKNHVRHGLGELRVRLAGMERQKE